MELKGKCKIARQYLKMSQYEFAKVIKSNQTEVSFIERGFIPEDKKKIDKIETIYIWSIAQ
jgi:transcriptional regulator with XRE-family HTH domain